MSVEATPRLTSFSHGGGCACKLGVDELDEVLTYVRTPSDPALLVGLDTPDDAAVYQVTDDMALVQTVDFFTPIVDDPYAWGTIAAANALSDVYAMGGVPRTALSLVAWPRSLDFKLLGRVLEGAADVCERAGVAIVGGHSVDDPEPKFGLAVTGIVQPDAVIHKGGAKPGCELVLTKPLGVGIISSGIKEGTAPEPVASAAIEVMSELNDRARDAAVAVGVEAGTDVTGFGFVGHLLQMLGSDLDAEVDAEQIPLLDGVVELVGAGVLPGGSRRNMKVLGDKVDAGPLSEEKRAVLFDAQTSGGLLLAVLPDRTEELLAGLRARGVGRAARIGRVASGSGRVRVSHG
jgi:selenide,water dikinase